MMFDSKIQEAYRKIKPSDSLRERVLAVDTAPVRAKVLPLRRLTNLAAAFVLFVALVILVRQTVSLDPNYVALSDGTVLSAEAVEVAPVTASYTGAAHVSFAREGGDEETTYPEPVQVDGCFCLTLHARGLASLEAADGSLFLYDEEPEAYVDFGSTAFFENACSLYWYVPETEDGGVYTLTFTDEATVTTLTLTYADGIYTLACEESPR